jgi:Domain of unknown function (DUF1611_C) P-loop domain
VGILKGSLPDGVILQHPPARQFRCDFPDLAMPTIAHEIELIEAISSAKVLAITLSHEDLAIAAIPPIIAQYETELQLPTTDVLQDGCQKLIQALTDRFPALGQKMQQSSLETVLPVIPLVIPLVIPVAIAPVTLRAKPQLAVR